MENSTFFSQQKVGLQHAVNHRFLGRCQMPHTYIINHEIVTTCWQVDSNLEGLVKRNCSACGIKKPHQKIENTCIILTKLSEIPVMHNSNQSTVIYNRQGVWATNRNHIHNPAVKILINQCCCKSAKLNILKIEDSHRKIPKCKFITRK